MEHIVLGDRLITIRTSSLEEKVWEGGGGGVWGGGGGAVGGGIGVREDHGPPGCGEHRNDRSAFSSALPRDFLHTWANNIKRYPPPLR